VFKLVYRQSIVELERDLDQLNLIKTETSDKLDHERWALHMELEKVSTNQLEYRIVTFEVTHVK
jgi:hypothetical protein